MSLGSFMSAVGDGFRGFAQDQQQRTANALAQQKEAREAALQGAQMSDFSAQAQLRNAQAAATTAKEQRLRSPEFAQRILAARNGDDAAYADVVATYAGMPGSESFLKALRPDKVDPIVGSPEWRQAKAYEASLQYHPPVQPQVVQYQGADGQMHVYSVDKAGHTATEIQGFAPKATGGAGGGATGAQAPLDDMLQRYSEIAGHANDLAAGRWKMTPAMQAREGMTYGIARENAAGNAPVGKQLAASAMDALGFGNNADFPRYQALMNSTRVFGDDAAKVFKGRQNEGAVLREVALNQLTPDDYKNPQVVHQKLSRLQNIIKLARLTNPAQAATENTPTPLNTSGRAPGTHNPSSPVSHSSVSDADFARAWQAGARDDASIAAWVAAHPAN